MRFTAFLMVVLGAARAAAADLKDLPPNTWVEIKYTTEQSSGFEKGSFGPQGWNKIVYDPDSKRVLFYDRWQDRKHGGWTIYGNCLFGLDPAAGKLTPIKVDHWTRIEPKGGGYRTLELEENAKEPTPCPRHVYHAFEYVPELKALFICNGANQSAMKDGKLLGHDLCDGAWRLDLTTKKWTKLDTAGQPPNVLDDAMAYSPEIKSLIYSGSKRQLWILDLTSGRWRKAKNSPPPRSASGTTIFHDPTAQRMLIVGGGPLDGWKKGKALEFRELYAFDPKTEEVSRLADSPTALYSSHLAFDSKQKLFVAVAVFDGGEHPSGIFCYDPRKNAWHEIKSTNRFPHTRAGWAG